MKPAILFLLIASLGCAAGGPARPSPTVTISQISQVAPVRLAELPLDMSVAHGVPVDYEITVTTPFPHPTPLAAGEVHTVGSSGAYSMKGVRHAFSLVIDPRSAAVFPIR